MADGRGHFNWTTVAGWALVAVTLLLALLQFNGVTAAAQAQAADHERRIVALESTTVTRREVDQMHEQLDRIEQKLDALAQARR